MRLAYWASFSEYLKANNRDFSLRRQVKDHWCSFGIGRAGFVISATINTKPQRVGVELYAHNDQGKVMFRQLLAQKAIIESEFGEAVDWQELPTKKAFRIAVYWLVDPADEELRQEIHSWMLDRMQRFKRVFADRVRNLVLGGGSID